MVESLAQDLLPQKLDQREEIDESGKEDKQASENNGLSMSFAMRIGML